MGLPCKCSHVKQQYNQLHHLPYRVEGHYLTQELAYEHPLMSLV